MENTQTFTCICGKTFKSALSYAGHRSHCTIYLLNKYGTLQPLMDAEHQRHSKARATLIDNAKNKNKQQNDDWVAEQHHCEKCGKLMTTKFGSGRFCSRKCANSRHVSAETKNKISKSLINSGCVTASKLRYKHNEELYNKSPRYCVICGDVIPYKHRNRRTCGKTCYYRLLGQIVSQRVVDAGGNLNPHPNKNCKSGTYHGIRCDSTYELAFVVYNIDNGREVIRCKSGFPYFYDGKKHIYYPDFIVDGVIYEIKNYLTPLVEAKAKAVPQTVAYTLLLKEELKPYLEYCCKTYGKCFWKALYDQ